MISRNLSPCLLRIFPRGWWQHSLRWQPCHLAVKIVGYHWIPFQLTLPMFRGTTRIFGMKTHERTLTTFMNQCCCSSTGSSARMRMARTGSSRCHWVHPRNLAAWEDVAIKKAQKWRSVLKSRRLLLLKWSSNYLTHIYIDVHVYIYTYIYIIIIIMIIIIDNIYIISYIIYPHAVVKCRYWFALSGMVDLLQYFPCAQETPCCLGPNGRRRSLHQPTDLFQMLRPSKVV